MRLVTWRTAPALAVLLLALLLLAFAQITRPLELSPDVNYDAFHYAALVDGLRTGAATSPASPFAYRVLPAAIVAVTGLDASTGFFALDVAALLGTGLVLLVLLRPHTTPVGALAAIVLWGLLPYGLRYAVHYPVLTDYLGTFLFAALLVSVQARRYVAFALLFVAAVLTRENLIVCAPLLALREAPLVSRRGVAAAAAAVPGLAALVAVHLWPPVAPPAATFGTSVFVFYQLAQIVSNRFGEAWRVIAAPLFAFGMLLGPLLSRRTAAVIRSEAGWTYLLVLTAITSTLGAADHDRYLFAIAPLVVLLVVRVLPEHARTRLLLVFIPLQVVASRVLMPLGSDFDSHAAFAVSLIPLDALAAWSAAIAGCSVIAALLGWTARRSHVLRTAGASR